VFCLHAVRLLRDPTPKQAMRVFHFSITYLAVVFAAMAVDVVVRTR
jgi:protoheme IX farnesyltransferase